MRHDMAERQAQIYEKQGKHEDARAVRYKGDMALLARLDELESQLDAGEIKLGINGQIPSRHAVVTLYLKPARCLSLMF